MSQKHVLHLALLIHDLGKGFLEDHREIGLKIAERTAQRLGLPRTRPRSLKFLVHKHLRMNHLAFRRDTSDEEMVVRFAVQVGSPELLQDALRAHGRRPRGGGAGRVGRLEGRDPHRPLPSDDAATRRREPRARRSTIYLDQRRGGGPRLPRSAKQRPVVRAAPGRPARRLPQCHARRNRRPTTFACSTTLPPGGATAQAQYLSEAATVQFTVGTSEAGRRRASSTSSPAP